MAGSLAGNYVYPATSTDKAKPKAKDAQVLPEERDKETRGTKEGKGVGADLPRRDGLYGSGEDEDEGWKGVKRVVVVGVHGWYVHSFSSFCLRS